MLNESPIDCPTANDVQVSNTMKNFHLNHLKKSTTLCLNSKFQILLKYTKFTRYVIGNKLHVQSQNLGPCRARKLFFRISEGPRSCDWSCAWLQYPIKRIDIGVVFSYTPYTRDTNTLSLSPWFNKKVSFNTLCWKAITSACTE